MQGQEFPSGIVSVFRHPLAWVGGAILGLVLLPYFVPILSDEGMVLYGHSYAVIPLILLVCLVTLFGRPAGEARDTHRFWIYLGIGFGCWFLGKGIWLTVGDRGLAPALASDFVYNLFYIFLLLAVEQQPGERPGTQFSRIMRRYSIIGGSLLLGAAFLYFYVLPATLSEATYQSWKPSILSSFFFDTYFTIRFIAKWRWSRNPVWKVRFAWLSVGFLLWVVIDALDVAAVQYGFTALEIGTATDIIWFVPFIPFLIGCLLGRNLEVGETAVPAQADSTGVLMQPPVGSTPLLLYAFLTPCMHLGLTVGGFLDDSILFWREILVLAETVVLAAMVFRIHRLVFRENQSLRSGYEAMSFSLAESNRSLADRIGERTRELEELNAKLASDIRQRTIVEERLRSSEARNQALISAIPDSLYVLGRDGRVIEALPTEGSPMTPPFQPVGGTSFEVLFTSSGSPKAQEAIERVLDTGDVVTIPCRAVVAGEGRQFECRFSPLGLDEVLVLAQDVTRRLEMEALLQQARELESLGVMAGGLAHDFNNMLVGILGNAQLVLEDLGQNHPLSRPISVIEKSALRASKLTDNLLAYAGKAHIQLRPLDIRLLIMEMEDVLIAAVPENCRLHMRLDPVQMWIKGDEAQITQILLNLVLNAGEALGEQGGEIWIYLDRKQPAPRPATVSLPGEPDPRGPCIRLRVQDEGCGMDPETQRRIFDPFFSSKAAGRGLGLAAALGIVAHHMGSITVDSQPGEGTVFSVVFPEETVARPGQELVSRRPPESASRGTILVADDEPDVRDLMASYLSRLGFKVLVAENGSDAVARFRKHRDQIRAVILDFAMPGMNGVEALSEIRRENPSIPAVMISGYSERQAMARLEGQALTHFLHKPFELKDFQFLKEENMGFPRELKGS